MQSYGLISITANQFQRIYSLGTSLLNLPVTVPTFTQFRNVTSSTDAQKHCDNLWNYVEWLVKWNVLSKGSILDISKKRMNHIIHKFWQIKMICKRWVPCFWNIDQVDKRMRLLKANLAQIKQNKNEFRQWFVTMDGTWIHHYAHASNWQSTEWLLAGETNQKLLETQMSSSAQYVIETSNWSWTADSSNIGEFFATKKLERDK